IASHVARPDAVVAVSVPDWSVTPAARDFGRPAEIAGRIERCNAAAAAEAGARGFLFADVTEASRSRQPGWLSADQLHPGDPQYAAWADAIWAAVGLRWARAVAVAG
ncbi:MAG: hypothetical protein M3024_01340, partial [Candidatus Dormibacteraeota bacterium]|nr:hypothetical protein [Candidatus Dormibacteraeota bacterium]